MLLYVLIFYTRHIPDLTLKKFNFTKSAIEAIETPTTGRAYYYDTKVQGLELRVTATGIVTGKQIGRAHV